MKINEIKPSAAKDLLSYSRTVKAQHPADTDPDDHFKRPYPLDKIREWLDEHGFRHIGTGANSYVYINEDANLVVKITNYSDDCFDSFARYAHKHKSNPHLPRISIPKKFDVTPDFQSFYITFIEKLIPLESPIMNPTIVKELSQWSKRKAPYVGVSYQDKNLRQSLQAHFLGDRKKVYEALKFLKNNKKLVNTVKDVYDYFDQSGCLWDTHFKNFMKRKNGDIVLTDPVAGAGSHEWRYRKEEEL